MQGVAQGASWSSSASAEHSAHNVNSLLEPLPGRVATDFGFVSDPHIFSVDVAGERETVPAHLLFDVTDVP